MALPETPSLRLDGKRALVTGGSRGIGFAAVAALCQAGAEVVFFARSIAGVTEAEQSLRDAGFRATGAALDITDTLGTAARIDTHGPFDVLVNSAGLARHAEFLAVTSEDYDAVMAINLRATLFVSQAVARGMIARGKGGSIITVSSQMGHVGGPRRTVYAASKFAVEGLSKSMAIELGPQNIRVNTLCPTFIRTELSAHSLDDAAFQAWALSKIKLGRLGVVEDIMGPVVFLASDAARLITGTSLLVDGGWTAE